MKKSNTCCTSVENQIAQSLVKERVIERQSGQVELFWAHSLSAQLIQLETPTRYKLTIFLHLQITRNNNEQRQRGKCELISL